MRLDYFEDIFKVWKSLPDDKRKNAHYVSRRFGIGVTRAATDFIPQLYDRLSEEDDPITIPAQIVETKTIHLGKNTKTVPLRSDHPEEGIPEEPYEPDKTEYSEEERILREQRDRIRAGAQQK